MVLCNKWDSPCGGNLGNGVDRIQWNEFRLNGGNLKAERYIKHI
jgi:hypothetical protein